MILVDTAVLLWLAADQKKLSSKAKKCIIENVGNLFVSSISLFEIALKASKGKLDLPMEAEKWFTKALRFHGIQEIPIDSRIAACSVRLPSLHNDPCDRFIIATALLHAMTIITSDSLIAQYEGVKVIW
ncbi:MAG: type II toxin-antitoxin system VapC family toxin [bacterium]